MLVPLFFSFLACKVFSPFPVQKGSGDCRAGKSSSGAAFPFPPCYARSSLRWVRGNRPPFSLPYVKSCGAGRLRFFSIPPFSGISFFRGMEARVLLAFSPSVVRRTHATLFSGRWAFLSFFNETLILEKGAVHFWFGRGGKGCCLFPPIPPMKTSPLSQGVGLLALPCISRSNMGQTFPDEQIFPCFFSPLLTAFFSGWGFR